MLIQLMEGERNLTAQAVDELYLEHSTLCQDNPGLEVVQDLEQTYTENCRTTFDAIVLQAQRANMVLYTLSNKIQASHDLQLMPLAMTLSNLSNLNNLSSTFPSRLTQPSVLIPIMLMSYKHSLPPHQLPISIIDMALSFTY